MQTTLLLWSLNHLWSVLLRDVKTSSLSPSSTSIEKLFDMAASQGHAEAARRVAHLYDPRELTPERKGQYEANIQTAYTWYRKAIDMGSDEARIDLSELHEVVREMAANENEQAQSLLNRRWPD